VVWGLLVGFGILSRLHKPLPLLAVTLTDPWTPKYGAGPPSRSDSGVYLGLAMLTHQRLDLYLSSPLCAVSWPVSNVSSIFLSGSELTIQLAYLERSWVGWSGRKSPESRSTELGFGF
jgi:hypothetical protein